MLTALITITSVTQIILSLFVFLRSRYNLSNRLFFFIGIASLGWALTNYLTIQIPHSPVLIYVVRLILFFVVIQNTFFYMFARTFPNTSWQYSRRQLTGYIVFSIFAASITLSPYVFTSVKIENNLAITTAGPAILVFVLHAGFSIISAFKAMFRKICHSKGSQESQLRILLVASFLNWLVVPVTNFALTPLLKTTFFIKYSPIYTFVFASIIAYAIVAQKLFDIRAAVARSVAYLLIVATMAVTYGVVVFGVIDVLFRGPSHELLRQILSLVVVTPLALSFQSIKNFFDKITNRLFYRDAYDPQTFLDQFNKTIIENIELGILLRRTAQVIEENLKCERVTFSIFSDDNSRIRYIGSGGAVDGYKDMKELRDELEKTEQKTFIYNELQVRSQIMSLMRKNNITVLTQLKSPQSKMTGAQAYLGLGPKKSGNVYTKQDLRIIEIITNELVIAIQNALRFEEIENFNITLQRRIEEATIRVKRANERLKALDETKDDFISMASHQLRTPLTSVKGYLSMVLEEDAGKLTKKQRAMLDQSFLSSQRMVYLIADLLNVSRLKTGKFVIDRVPVNLAETVEQELKQLTETAAGRSITLEYNKPKTFPVLLLDETKIRQVIMNFADNAIYYTPSGGHISVDLLDKPNTVELRIKDSGIGVPKSEQPHLFTKFYRAGNARKARPDGTGLGLFMAKKVVIAQGGVTIFESTEGKGSTFGFIFNKPASVAPAGTPVHSK